MLLAGFIGILVTLIGFGIDTTSVYLGRIEAVNGADAAARAAADEISVAGYYGGQGRTLDPVLVDQAARDSLAGQVPSSRIEQWEIDFTEVTGGGNEVLVQVTATVNLPLTAIPREAVTGPVQVTVQSRARGAAWASVG